MSSWPTLRHVLMESAGLPKAAASVEGFQTYAFACGQEDEILAYSPPPCLPLGKIMFTDIVLNLCSSNNVTGSV